MTTTPIRTLKLGIAAFSAALLCLNAHAAILNSTYETQLESWLGAGDQDFTNVYTFTSGDAASAFHAAADNKGATFALMKVVAEGITQIVGGYNPQSWDASIGNYRFTPNDADRTAFIFNLTDSLKLTQNLSTDADGHRGVFQTYNYSINGPDWGAGRDLSSGMGSRFGTNARANAYSYGQRTNVFGNSGSTDFTISELEVYTFAAASVPDASSTLGLLGLAIVGLVGIRSRMKRS